MAFFLTRTSHTTSNARSLLPSVPNYDWDESRKRLTRSAGRGYGDGNGNGIVATFKLIQVPRRAINIYNFNL